MRKLLVGFRLAGCRLAGCKFVVLAACAMLAVAAAPVMKAAQQPADPAMVADLLKASDLVARNAWLDAHTGEVTDALRVALRNTAERLRREGKLAEGLQVCETERMVAVRLHDIQAIVSADWGVAQANSQLGDYDRALAALRDAQEVARSNHNDTLERQTLGNLAIVYRLRGNLDQALALQRQVLQVWEAAHDTPAIARTLNNISIIQEQLGAYREALAAAQRSLTLQEPDSVQYAHTLLSIGNIFLSQGEMDLAVGSYQRALAQREQTASSKLVVLEMLGEAERQRHHFDDAAGYLAQAREMAESSHQQPQVAFTLRIEALVQADRGDKAGAVPLLERSLAIGRAVKDPDIISYTLTNLASLRRDLGDPAAALALAREAIALGESQPSRGLAQAYSEAGRASMALGQREEARTALRAAIDITETLRDQVSGGGLEREQFLENSLGPYQAMMALLLREDAPEAALQYAERTRARALLDEMQRGHVDFAHALTPDEREQEGAIERRLRSAKGHAREQARDDLAAWRTKLFAAHPELRLARGAAEIPSLTQLHEIVRDPTTAVLAYASVEDHMWLFVITAGSPTPTLAVHRIAIDNDTLATRVHHLRDGLANRSLEFAADARTLYADLLEPASEALRGVTRLVIVPDGVLWDLPFQVLQAPSGPDRGHYLIEHAIIEYAPSLTFLQEARARATPREGLKGLLALGNPAFELAPMAKRAAPAALPETEREVRALATLYGPRQTTMLVGAAASEQRVKADAGRYRVLHFATHGMLDDHDPMYSALLLAHAPGNDAEDGRLEARELMNLRLNADLVVLSACDTARGRYGAGEGLLGLSWAMLLAGSRDVVVSQWKVDTGSTSQLMVAFHRALVQQRASADIGAALQRAARQVMQDPRYRHPFYWAAFRTVGVGH
jgi:CHAT domain-containing protein